MLLIFPTQCRAGAANGVFLCIQVLIPSLFPYMVLASFVSCSGIASKIPDSFGKITRALFGLPKESFVAIVLSLIGGYPVGAKSISSLLSENRITEKQAERMSMFCVAAGPGFLVTYIGCAMLGNPLAGYILLISQVLSFFILGMISKFAVKDNDCVGSVALGKTSVSIGNALVNSVSDAIRSCGLMCAMVVLFGSICEIFLYLTASVPDLSWITAIIEITNGTKILAQGYSLVLISAMCGFGGLCVHFQVFVLLGKIRISKGRFLLFRIMQSFLSTVFTYTLLKLFPKTQSVFSTVEKTAPALNKGITGCVFLIICCVVFLASLKTTNANPRKSR